MSEAQAAIPAPATGRHQRRARNYLLDRHFQLKYTGFLVGIALVLSIGLGAILWKTSMDVLEQSGRAFEQGQETVRQGQETVSRGKEVIAQSRKVSQVVSMNIAKEYKDDPELAKTFSEEAAKDEQKLKEEQERLQKDAAFLEQQAQTLKQARDDLATQQKTLLFGLTGLLALLVVGIGIAGIMVTHKIAGPIFKMKRLLGQVGDGKLVVRERLRKGDELQYFFHAFESMVDKLRDRQKSEIARVDEIIGKIESGSTDESLTTLRKLRAEMQSHIE